MKRALSLLAALTVSTLALAQAPMATGEVTKLDKSGARVTLKHGEIKHLDMPPMTMVFQVKDAAMLGQVKTGDKVRFTAEKVGGQYTVTVLEAIK